MTQGPTEDDRLPQREGYMYDRVRVAVWYRESITEGAGRVVQAGQRETFIGGRGAPGE